ncbi:MAG: hypothetical protein ACXV3F_14735 [Frankiaceae bacterium]
MPHGERDGSAIERLAVFVGQWDLLAEIAGVTSEDARGSAVFEWMPGQRLLIERIAVTHPDAPDSLADNPDRPGEFVQHYFDSRGVVRLYDMTFDGATWTLSRTRPDFSPLQFQQRFTGALSPDHDTIYGRWEICEDGVNWRVDFPLTFQRRQHPQSSRS